MKTWQLAEISGITSAMSLPAARGSFSTSIKNAIQFYASIRRHLQMAQLFFTGLLVLLCALMEGLDGTAKNVLMLFIVVLIILDILCSLPTFFAKPSLEWVDAGLDFESEIAKLQLRLQDAEEKLTERNRKYACARDYCHAISKSFTVLSDALTTNSFGEDITPYLSPFWEPESRKNNLFAIPETDPYARLVVYLLDNISGKLSPVCDLKGAGIEHPPIDWDLKQGLTGACAFQQIAMVKGDLSTESTPLPASQKPLYKSGIAVPIIIKGNCAGVVTVTSSVAGLWVDGENPNMQGKYAKQHAEIVAVIVTVLLIEQAQQPRPSDGPTTQSTPNAESESKDE